ncbi:helix-turn-helix domain-containing protein [Chryseobacterium sp. MYb264]|uniref:helix-turn-helix domain-containing protein n=1 Tax=Chryseobacterium sp. MYb264 TaxID=2745153 RepID=UPI002E1085DA|nr:helix-turn-helix domain-containing protein [Chryseobacterium sp. MYb264]
MKNQVQLLRESKNLTQTELAEKAEISLRTVQRIEAGNIPKGYTLKALANALNTDSENLSVKEKIIDLSRAKLINLSALAGLIIPFGGIIFPMILTYKTKDHDNKELGKNIVSIQIILALITSVVMIVTPFIQKLFSLRFPVFLIPLLLFLVLKLIIIIMNGLSLNKKNDLYRNLKINFL